MSNCFVDVVFIITVNENMDVEKIQNKVEVAAKEIINEEKMIIILNDIWEAFQLHKLGIPSGIDRMN
ncbi:hypothetical protein OSB04_001162 [Centaurea solstitialis]|uniref:NB-ARC domain-containing protein n=1 Tax=Centaurea solstitialis TaxID=347529 RepID=A0AA38U118_9ASTR|nr:hypothetical protein OSB04_001162 [Centaurea solstitialis]